MNYFGMDIHGTYHKVVLVTDQGEVKEFDFENDEAGLQSLAGLVRAHQPCRIAMEACSGAYFLYDRLAPHADSVFLIDPVRFRRFYPKRGKKTDRIDATNLAEAARMGLDSIWVPDEKIRQARAVAQRRASLTEQRTACKNAIRSAFKEANVRLPKGAWSGVGLKKLRDKCQQLPRLIQLCVRAELRVLAALEASIDELDQLMAEEATRWPEVRLLMSIGGIGYHAAYIMMAELGEIGRFGSAKQLTSYAGICPSVSQTGRGDPRFGRITRKGRRLLRWIAVECAHSACKCSPRLRKLYWRVTKRTNSSKAKVAAGRKLLTYVYHVLKTNTLFSECDREKYQEKLRKMESRGGRRAA